MCVLDIGYGVLNYTNRAYISQAGARGAGNREQGAGGRGQGARRCIDFTGVRKYTWV